jgi:hypothetical protein
MTQETSNETNVVSQKIWSIVHALETIESEKEAIKEICASLKEEHDIKPSISKGAADRLLNPDKYNKKGQKEKLVDELYCRVATSKK